MIRGAYSRSGDARRHLERARPEGAELRDFGPLAVTWTPGPYVDCAEVDGITCVISGYLFDAPDAARALGVEDTGDAALLASAYRRHGQGALLELRGRFALVLWDRDRGQGILTSDLLAVEPWYLWRGSGWLAFGGRHHHLLEILPTTPGPDRVALTHWLGLGTLPEQRTLFEGVSELGPGRLVELGVDGDPVRRYWRPRYTGTLKGSRAELADGLRYELERSVRRRMSRRFTGVVLSGGLDSSIVTVLAARQQPPGHQLGTFSVLFPGEEYDETWKIREVVAAAGAEPRAVRLETQGALWACMRSLQEWKLPLGAAGALVDTICVNEAASEGAEVVFDGQTGDETLGFAPYVLADRLMRGRLLGALSLTRRFPWGRPLTWAEQIALLKRFGLKGAVPYGLGRRIRARRPREGVGPVYLNPKTRREFMEMQDVWAWKLDAPGPRWWQYLSDRLVEAPHREQRLEYLRQRAGAAGVLNESPLYDYDLIDYCLRLPPELAFAQAHTRPLAREAMRGLIPDEVRVNDIKANFSEYCYRVMVEADGPAIHDILTAPDAELAAYADMEWVRRRWLHERPKPGENTGPWGTEMWALLAAECWLRSMADPGFVERTLARPDVLPMSARRVALDEVGDARPATAG